ncbi:hypothetical protein [Escherichia coli]
MRNAEKKAGITSRRRLLLF